MRIRRWIACMALVISLAPISPARASQSLHSEQLSRAITSYRHASNGFHPDEASRKIIDAINDFDGYFSVFDAAIERAHRGMFADEESASAAVRQPLSQIDAQINVLKSAIAHAASADRTKIGQASSLDVQSATRKAKVQQEADRELLANVESVVQGMKDSWTKLHHQIHHTSVDGH